MRMCVRIGERTFTVEIDDLSARPIRAMVDGQAFEVWPELEAKPQSAAPSPAPAGPPPPGAAAAPGAVLAPIPGQIVSVAVAPGQRVQAGQELCVLEAMKMKSPIRSPRVGTVRSVRVSAGQTVKYREVLFDYAD